MKIHQKHSNNRRAGFTLAELLLALSVMTIILSAAAALAFAMGSAESATNDMGEKQARIRYATMRIRELARNSVLVFTYSTTGVVFWTGDANGDCEINGNEVAWLSTNAGSGKGTNLTITEFPDDTSVVERRNLQFSSAISSLLMSNNEEVTTLFENCTSVSISLSNDVTTVDVTLVEDGQTRDFQICAAIQASAKYLLSSTYSDLVEGDDDF